MHVTGTSCVPLSLLLQKHARGSRVSSFFLFSQRKSSPLLKNSFFRKWIYFSACALLKAFSVVLCLFCCWWFQNVSGHQEGRILDQTQRMLLLPFSGWRKKWCPVWDENSSASSSLCFFDVWSFPGYSVLSLLFFDVPWNESFLLTIREESLLIVVSREDFLFPVLHFLFLDYYTSDWQTMRRKFCAPMTGQPSGQHLTPSFHSCLVFSLPWTSCSLNRLLESSLDRKRNSDSCFFSSDTGSH